MHDSTVSSELPEPGTLSRTGPLTRLLLAPNAGPMTLDGTNSYVIAAPDSPTVVVVDPGPLDEGHLAALAAAGTVELVLISHHHCDHTDGSARLAELTGAPVRAFDPQFCIGGEPLVDGEVINAAGTQIRLLATPGHTADSFSFVLPDDGPHGSVLTGDTVLGRGTTIIAHPDGAVAPYFLSLDALAALGEATVLPAHGPPLPSVAAICAQYREHRMARLEQLRQALESLGHDATIEQLTDLIYTEAPAAVRFAAEASLAAQLAYLRGTD